MTYANRSIGAWVFLTLSAVLLTGCGSDTADAPRVETSIRLGDSTDSSATGPATTRDQLYPVVRVATSMGDFTVRLNTKDAPSMVSNFLDYAQRGHYENTIFHYVDAGFMVLGGGYTADGELKHTRAPVASEAHNGLLNTRGTIAMTRESDYEHSAACQFFFNLGENSMLDHVSREDASTYGYCVFGEVTDGMDVLDAIASVKVHDTSSFQNMPVKSVVIKSIQRLP